jgi:structural maintenance of chromosome 4
VVSLDGAVFERSGTMSGGGGKPRGGRMGTAIRDSTVSRESIANAEQELENVKVELAATRQRVSVATQQHQSALKSVSKLELDIAKIKMEVSMLVDTMHDLVLLDARFILLFLKIEYDIEYFISRTHTQQMASFLEQLEALKGQQSDISKQLEALKSGAVPNKEELDQIQSLDTEVAQGEALLADLNKKSSKLRAKVQLLSNTSNVVLQKVVNNLNVPDIHASYVVHGFLENDTRVLTFPQAQDLQHKMENAGGEELKQKKALVEKLQKVLQCCWFTVL